MIFAVFDVLLAVNMCINYSFFYNYIHMTAAAQYSTVLNSSLPWGREMGPHTTPQRCGGHVAASPPQTVMTVIMVMLSGVSAIAAQST